MIEGTQGITIDSASADLDLKGNKISLSASAGVSVDGGGGAVDVKAGSSLSLTGVNAKLEGSGTTEVKGGSLCNIQAGLIKLSKGPAKLLATGEVPGAYTVRGIKVSGSAREKIAAAGGRIEE